MNRLTPLLLLLFIGNGYYLFAQTKEELKKKYENSNLHEETDKKMKTDYVFPDSLILPPLHFTNSFYQLDSDVLDFDSISIDVDVLNDIPDHYSFYISPFNLELNGMPLYCGIQTKGGGIDVKTGKEKEITMNGIFSRWYERTNAALRTTGYYASSDDEGDFISVRNHVGWGKGSYRITLKKDGYIAGAALPDSFDAKSLYFSWGDYEHTWVTMTVEDLQNKKVSIIGSLAFPGKILRLDKMNVSFTEQYKYVIDFRQKPRKLDEFGEYIHYADLPNIQIIQKNLKINGKEIILAQVITNHNATHHPDQSNIKGKMPKLSSDTYDKQTGELKLNTGKLVSW